MAAALFALAMAVLTYPRAIAGTASDPIHVHWKPTAIVRVTLTPNYNAGFGQVVAIIGSQPAPTHGPNAVLNGGSVDFGDVLAGKNYLYKYAVHLNVQSNSTTGLNVYGEGAAAFFNQADSSSVPISQAVYWLNSTSGSPADNNTGFSAAVPFQQTGGAVTGGSFAVPASIAYTVYPAPISQSALANTDFYYDYQLHVPGAATGGDYFVWVVYTVVAR